MLRPALCRPRVPWERQWPYEATRREVEILPDVNEENREATACLGRQTGLMRTQHWNSDTVVIAQEPIVTRTWERSFTVSTWNDEVIKRMCMDMRRNYIHLKERRGAKGIFTIEGESTNWRPT